MITRKRKWAEEKKGNWVGISFCWLIITYMYQCLILVMVMLNLTYVANFAHTVLCKSNASEMREFRSLSTWTFQESSRESSSDNSRPFERNFPGTKNAISSTFRYKRYFTITRIVSLTQCPKFRSKQTQQFFTRSISIYPS